MSRQRLLLIAACALGLVLLGVIALGAGLFRPAPSAALIGGPFQMVNQDGKPVDESLLKGKWSVVFFGYTACPDICPGTMQALRGAVDLLGPKGKDVQIVFVSVDAGRDTPVRLRDWLDVQSLPPGTVGLTGTPQQVAAMARTYRVVYEIKGEGTDYLVNHSTAAYLMTPRGRFDRVLAYGLTPEQMADQIRRAMRGD
ncbi:MAG TPA: SCO family protein [Caulobacter sp.]|nr:SCO family protein [Caulobacter sp.]